MLGHGGSTLRAENGL